MTDVSKMADLSDDGSDKNAWEVSPLVGGGIKLRLFLLEDDGGTWMDLSHQQASDLAAAILKLNREK